MAGSDVEVWATAISTNADRSRRVIFRYAKDFRPGFDRATRPDRILVVWPYETENGQPGAEEHRRMNLLEDCLAGDAARGAAATLVLVSTGENLREWTFYARSEEEFMEGLNRSLAGMPESPIEIHTASDPTWSVYVRFAEGVREMVQ